MSVRMAGGGANDEEIDGQLGEDKESRSWGGGGGGIRGRSVAVKNPGNPTQSSRQPL